MISCFDSYALIFSHTRTHTHAHTHTRAHACTPMLSYSHTHLCTLAPSDYIAQVNTVVTFEPGQSLQSVITVTVNPDAVREGRESFAVRLSLPPPARLLGWNWGRGPRHGW